MKPQHGPTYQCKMICIGDCQVGKPTMLLNYLKDLADPNVPATIGVSCIHRSANLNGCTYKLDVFDTAG